LANGSWAQSGPGDRRFAGRLAGGRGHGGWRLRVEM